MSIHVAYAEGGERVSEWEQLFTIGEFLNLAQTMSATRCQLERIQDQKVRGWVRDLDGYLTAATNSEHVAAFEAYCATMLQARAQLESTGAVVSDEWWEALCREPHRIRAETRALFGKMFLSGEATDPDSLEPILPACGVTRALLKHAHAQYVAEGEDGLAQSFSAAYADLGTLLDAIEAAKEEGLELVFWV